MRTIKLVVIGASGVGKTSLRNQYISGQFTTGYRATIGADFITKTIPHYANPDEKITLQIWDTAGQERFSSLSSAFFRGADAVLLMFDVNQARTLDALTKWWNEFRDLAPVADDEVNKFCCVFVGNKIDIVPASTNGVVGQYSGRSTPPERIHEVRIHEFIDTLIPPCTLPEPSASDSSVAIRPQDSVDFIPVVDRPLPDGPPTHSPSPPRTNSIDIGSYHHRRRRQSRSRSRSTLFRGGTVGTMTTTHTLSVYQTPSSSFFDTFESARSSPVPPSPSPSSPSSPLSSRSPSHSPHHSHSPGPARRKQSMSSLLSDAQTITPSLFVRDATTPQGASTTCTTPQPQPVSTPASPEAGTKLFLTSAKTGEGVVDVFEYVARRVVSRWEYEEAVDARTLHMADTDDEESSTIRLHGSKGLRETRCCRS